MANTNEIKTNEAAQTSSVIPIELTGTTTVEKVKEITEKLEQGIVAANMSLCMMM